VPKKENQVGKYLDVFRRVEAESIQPSPAPESSADLAPDNPYSVTLDALRLRCPDHIPTSRWQQALADSDTFVTQWGAQAHALAWTARDLWGLHKPPETPHVSYSRLSRYDATGLCWLLQGRQVVALTADTATIRWPGGPITTYRKTTSP
jgi:hypothetical protein